MALRVRKGNSELFTPVITIFTLLHQDIFKYIKMILPFSCVRVHCMHKNSQFTKIKLSVKESSLVKSVTID